MTHNNKVIVTPVGVLDYHRVYERYMFFYIVIMSVWLWLASYVFGYFKMESLSAKQNLALGFVYYLFFAAMIALTLAIYRLTLHRFSETDKHQQLISELLEETETQEKHDELYDLLRVNGEFSPSRGQELAVMGIFWILIFELYILYFWIDNFVLVWQPEWIQAVAQWIIDHTNQDSILRFTFDAPGSRRSITWRAEMRAILDTPEGSTIAAFQGWLLFSYPVLIACMYKVLWHSLDWLGFERVNPRSIHSFGRFLWISFLSIFMLAFLIVPTAYLFFIHRGASVKFVEGLHHDYFSDLKLYLMFALFHIWGQNILQDGFNFGSVFCLKSSFDNLIVWQAA